MFGWSLGVNWMIRISGIVLPNKHISVALRSIYGIGKTRALEICEKVGVSPATKVSEIQEDIANLLQKVVAEYEVEGDLRRRIAINIKRLRDIKCYRGTRHRRNLPVRGQRTKTNARTRKGRKKSAGSGRK
jgi:small subunit ribosomal protein S13